MSSSSPNSHLKTHSQVKQFWIWALLAVHVLCGVCTLCFVCPLLSRRQKDLKIQKWSYRLLAILSIELFIHNEKQLIDPPYLLASNHISWLDIHAINALKPIRFVAKSEVRGWPIFGWMAVQLGAVFIKRDSGRHAKQVGSQMADVLQRESICIFPEGTSTVGKEVLAFKPNLFESAVISQVPVIPMVIQYKSKSTGLRSEVAAFIGEMGLLESMANIIATQDLQAHLTLLPTYALDAGEALDRKKIASFCQESIAKAI